MDYEHLGYPHTQQKSINLKLNRSITMNEKLMQDLLKNFPEELIEEGLTFYGREIQTGNRRLDLAFKDRRDRLLLVEVQMGALDTKHIDRHIDFLEGFMEKNPDTDIRLMYIANRIDHLRKAFLDRRGYEYLEIPQSKFIELAQKKTIKIDDNIKTIKIEALQNKVPAEEYPIQVFQSGFNVDEQKRAAFIRGMATIMEKEFWELFFGEIDKRNFVNATFQANEFGVHIHNKRHFCSSGGKYSLMFTRNGSFKMNDLPYQGQSWNGLNRLKNWCTTPGLPEKFYSELYSKNLLLGRDYISIGKLVAYKKTNQLINDLFECIDIFR